MVMGSRTGAFSTYVKNRGEPDGHTTAGNETTIVHQPPPPPAPPKGRCDDAFTPSPVERPPVPPFSRGSLSGLRCPPASRSVGGVAPRTLEETSSSLESPQPSPCLSLTLSHQTKIRALYTAETQEVASVKDHLLSSPTSSSQDGSSPASSITNWESGQCTIRRQRTCAAAAISRGDSGECGVGEVVKGVVTGPDSDFGHHFQRMAAIGRSDDAYRTSSLPPKGRAPPPPDSALQKLAVRVERVQEDDDSYCRDAPNMLSKRTEGSNSPIYEHLGEAPSPVAGKMPSAKSMAFPSLPHDHPLSRTLSSLESKLDSRFGRPLPGGKMGCDTTVSSMSSSGIYAAIRDQDGEEAAAEAQGARLGPGVLQNPICVAQLSRLHREAPISDVYHDRNVGLGLAPSLSKLLVSAVASPSSSSNAPSNGDAPLTNWDADHAFGDGFNASGLSSFIDSLYTSDGPKFGEFQAPSLVAKLDTSSEPPHHPPPPPPPPPSAPPKRMSRETRTGTARGDSKTQDIPPPPPAPRPPKPPNSPSSQRSSSGTTLLLTRDSSSGSSTRGSMGDCLLHTQKRDEGDGHSMTESHYGSPPFSTEVPGPKGTDIQSPYSSFTLYRPHRDGSKGRSAREQEVETGSSNVAATTQLSSARPRHSTNYAPLTTLNPAYEQYDVKETGAVPDSSLRPGRSGADMAPSRKSFGRPQSHHGRVYEGRMAAPDGTVRDKCVSYEDITDIIDSAVSAMEGQLSKKISQPSSLAWSRSKSKC